MARRTSKTTKEEVKVEYEYCECGTPGVYTKINDFGYWYVCTACEKVVEGSYEYFNHYDGEDHCDIY